MILFFGYLDQYLHFTYWNYFCIGAYESVITKFVIRSMNHTQKDSVSFMLPKITDHLVDIRHIVPL